MDSSGQWHLVHLGHPPFPAQGAIKLLRAAAEKPASVFCNGHCPRLFLPLYLSYGLLRSQPEPPVAQVLEALQALSASAPWRASGCSLFTFTLLRDPLPFYRSHLHAAFLKSSLRPSLQEALHQAHKPFALLEEMASMASKRMKMRVKPSPEAVATTLELLRPYMVNLLAKEWDYMMKGEYFDPKPPRPAFLRNGAPNTSPPAPPSMSPALAIDETAAWEELRSLLVRVDMVGLTERMDETLLALQHFTGLPTVRLTRPFASTNANLSRLPPEVRQVEQQFLASLAAESTLDSTIYGEAQRLFQQNVVARVPDLPARLRQLRAEGRLDAPGQAPPPPWPPPNVTALLAADAAGNPIHEAQLASLSVTELRHLLYFRQPPPCVLALFIHLERTGGSTLGAYNILELNPLIYDSFHALAEPTQAVLRLAARNPLAFHERLGRVMLEYHGGQPHNYTAALALVRRLAAPGSAFAAAGCTALAFTHFRAPLGYLHSQVGTRWRYSIFAPRFDHHVRLNSTPEVWTQELIDMESRLLLGRYFAGALPNKEIHNFTQPLGPRALEAIKGVYALFDWVGLTRAMDASLFYLQQALGLQRLGFKGGLTLPLKATEYVTTHIDTVKKQQGLDVLLAKAANASTTDNAVHQHVMELVNTRAPRLAHYALRQRALTRLLALDADVVKY